MTSRPYEEQYTTYKRDFENCFFTGQLILKNMTSYINILYKEQLIRFK